MRFRKHFDKKNLLLRIESFTLQTVKILYRNAKNTKSIAKPQKNEKRFNARSHFS
jgi:hypothetical protein